MSPPYGLIQALTTAIGEADTEIAGLHMTRLTSPVTPAISLTATFVWNGTLTITTTNTSEVVAGDWIWLDADAQWFEVETVVVNTSLTITNPYARIIPTGSTASSKARQSFPVETTVDWSNSGKIGIDGVVYHYASKTNIAFDGITFLQNGETTPGALKQHRTQATVLDLNRVRTALDFVRRAMLVDYAEGDDLNALGRNLGVLRLPFISGDDRFREIIKALAYNPKGTILGLQLALNGLVGAGNYSIYENLQAYPCTVFISLLGAAATNNSSFGKAYLSGPEEVNCLNEAAIPLTNLVVDRGSVHSIYFKPEDRLTDCRLAYPSADQIAEYTGAALTPVWTYQGTAGGEGTAITPYLGDPSGGTQWGLPVNEARYKRGLRITTNSITRLEIVAYRVAGGTDSNANMALTLSDGTRAMSAFIQGTPGLDTRGLSAALTGPFALLVGTSTAPSFIAHTYTLEKYRDLEWRLYVDGQLVSVTPYATGANGAGFTRAMFGISGNPATVAGWIIKQASIWVQDDTDFASARGNSGIITGPNTLDLVSYTPQANDINKTVLLSGLTAPTVGGGRNNGRWLVTGNSGTQLTLGAINQVNAVLAGGAFPTRITVPLSGRQFQYPDDLGRNVTISGSTLGNNGTWAITRLLDPDTLINFASWASHQPAQTNVCEVTGPVFVPEVGLAWYLSPGFANENPIKWALPNSIDVTGGNSVALRQPLPVLEVGTLKVLAITYSDVLSSGILLDISAINEIVQEVPELLWSYYPFYLADPLGFVRTYLDEITAAGVIPEFLIT